MEEFDTPDFGVTVLGAADGIVVPLQPSLYP